MTVNNPKIRSRKEIIQDEDLQWTQDLMEKILLELQVCKSQIDDLMSDSGWDTAMFDVEVDLKVKFDKTQVRVREAWRAVGL